MKPSRAHLLKRGALYLLAMGLLMPLASCQTMTPVSKNSRLQGIHRIAVMPFEDLARAYGANTSYRCPLSGKIYEIGTVMSGADEQLTDKLMDDLSQNSGYRLIAPSQTEGVRSDLLAGTGSDLGERDLLTHTASALGADAILVGRVYRYKERVGTDYGVDKPASVAFDLMLIAARNGAILWTGNFDETQASLSENLLAIGTFIKNRGRWVTAAQLADSGLDAMLATFPKP
jgi:TolB-like protein